MTSRRTAERRIALLANRSGGFTAVELDHGSLETARHELSGETMPEWVAAREREDPPRWVVRSARDVCPALLAAGVRLGRTHDLLLCHAILRDTDRVGARSRRRRPGCPGSRSRRRPLCSTSWISTLPTTPWRRPSSSTGSSSA